jgi:hypothetical protein
MSEFVVDNKQEKSVIGKENKSSILEKKNWDVNETFKCKCQKVHGLEDQSKNVYTW